MARNTQIDKDYKYLRSDRIDVNDLYVNGNSVAGGLALGSSEVIDMNGEADALILDADADTTISAPTDDQIDIEIAGADDFTFTANTFTALSGSTIKTNTIAETTAASGVTVDGVLLKDGGAVFADAASIEVDTINEATAAAGVTVDGVLIKDGGAVFADAATIEIDTINEATAAAGVTIDGVLIKDTAVQGRTPPIAVTGDGAISIPTYNAIHFITKAGVAAMTLADPTATTHDGVELTFIATTANAHTLDNSAGSGFNGVGAGGDLGTFGGAIGDLIKITAYQGVWYTLINTNVTLS